VWLEKWRAGGPEALDQLLPLVYRELRDVAGRQLRRESPAHTLSATALVHEAYLRLIAQRQPAAVDRTHFFAIAARTMRRILVDHARARLARKRGGERPVALGHPPRRRRVSGRLGHAPHRPGAGRAPHPRARPAPYAAWAAPTA
jgi:RNA polymerase sigma factor (TIGR02999 family)